MRLLSIGKARRDCTPDLVKFIRLALLKGMAQKSSFYSLRPIVGGRRHAGAAPQGGLAQVLSKAVDLDGGEVGEHRGLLQAFLMCAERPSAVTA